LKDSNQTLTPGPNSKFLRVSIYKLSPKFSVFVGSEDGRDDTGGILFDDQREEFRGGRRLGKGKKRFL
jgi:hypothetical protein